MRYEDQLMDEADYYNQKEVETMNLQQLTNERFLSDIKSLNKTIEAQAAEIAKLQSQLEHLETVGSGRLDEVVKLRTLLERWQKFSNNLWISDFKEEADYFALDNDTSEALK